MLYADRKPMPVLYRPDDPLYDERIRRFQGCPTIAITRGGRIYAGWYSGGRCEPHIENYNLVVTSDDGGATWSKPLLVIPSSREELVQALDIELWTAPDGTLYVFWVQNNVAKKGDDFDRGIPGMPYPYSAYEVDGYLFGDKQHAMWYVTCADPDAADPVFSAPALWDHGFLRCKPLVLDSGRWLLFNYDQLTDRYGYSVTDDGGRTRVRRYGSVKIATPFDESMAYQRRDGSVRMFARTSVGELAEAVSRDGGDTWEETKPSGIDSPNTRFFVARTPSGNVLLVNNDDRRSRTNMTLYLSEDDGATWKYKRRIDSRAALSYPDADFFDNRIWLVYDRERTGAREILFLSFTEDDIRDPAHEFVPQVISRPE